MTTRTPNQPPTPEAHIEMREAAYLSQSRRSRSRDHKAAMAQRRTAEQRRARLECLADEKTARRSFRHFKRTMLQDSRVWKPVKLRLESQIAARRPRKKKADGRGRQRLPSLGFDIVDRAGRRGVFLSVQYDGAKGNARGVFRRRIEYAAFSTDVVCDPDGRPMLFSNVAKTVDEAVAIADEVEAFNRSERINAKVCTNLIMVYPRPAGPQEREKIMRRFTQRAFADEGVPFFGLNHEPKRGGRVHNGHGHVTVSMRPVHREGPYRFLISKDLRVDLDGEEGMARLRRILAEVTTQVMREAGFAHEYTHLSNAARGLAAIPQESLGKEQTEAAKRGAQVAANERNSALVSKNRPYFLDQIKAWAAASTATAGRPISGPIAQVRSTILPHLTRALPHSLARIIWRPLMRDCVRVDLSGTRIRSPSSMPTISRLAASDPVFTSPLHRPADAIVPAALPPRSLQPVRSVTLMPRAPAARFAAPTTAAPLNRRITSMPIIAPAELITQPSTSGPAALNLRPTALKLKGIERLARRDPVHLEPVAGRVFARRVFARFERVLLPLYRAAYPGTLAPLLDFGGVRATGRLPVEGPHCSIPRIKCAVVRNELPARHAWLAITRPHTAPPRLLEAARIGVPANLRVVERGAFSDASKVARAVNFTGRCSTPGPTKPALRTCRLVLPQPAVALRPTGIPSHLPTVPLLKMHRASHHAQVPLIQRDRGWAANVLPLSQARGGGLTPLLLPTSKPLRVTVAKLSLPVTSTTATLGRTAAELTDFTWLREKIQSVRAELDAARELEPSRTSSMKEKAGKSHPGGPRQPTTGPGSGKQLHQQFLLAKTEQDRRKAAVAIRKNKAALDAMNARGNPLWTAEQARFESQQAAASQGISRGRS